MGSVDQKNIPIMDWKSKPWKLYNILSINSMTSTEQIPIKLVVVGDGSVGKTCLLIR